jgi:D-3-phosphoglycerate dehydrogenase
MKFNMQMIQALAKCRLIALGTVGVDYIDVAAATEKGIPVTNCPDTFIEEVADHAMMLLLATHRRAIEQDRMVREGRWTEGRPAAAQGAAPDGTDARLHRLRPGRPRGRRARASRSACA